MDRPPPAIRPLSDEESARAQGLYEAIVANVDVDPAGPPARAFDRARVAAISNSIDYFEDSEFRALASADAAIGGGGRAYIRWVGATYFEGEHNAPEDGIVGVSLPEFAVLIETDDPEPPIAALAGADVARALNNDFAGEWTVFAEDGSWMAASWEAGDFYVLGGSTGFMSAYRRARPGVCDDILTWLSSLGAVFVDRVPVRRYERPRVPRFLRGLINRTEYQERFAGSTTGNLLVRLYGREVAEELWALHLAMEEHALNPLVGDAWKELRAFKRERPELDTRLRQIWDGA